MKDETKRLGPDRLIIGAVDSRKVEAPLDALDRQIVEALRENARASVVELAKSLSAPRTTIAKRVTRLEKEGVVRGYTARVDHDRIGDGQVAYLLLKVLHDPMSLAEDLGRRFTKIKGVEDVHILAGEWCLIVKLRASHIQEVHRTVEQLVKEEGVVRTTTLTCLKSIQEPV